MSELRPRRRRFVEEYLIDLNATQAAVRAGYSPRTAYSMGQQLLKNIEIRKAIDLEMDARSSRTMITSDQVLHDLGCIAFIDIKTIFNDRWCVRSISEIPEDARRAIAGIEVEEIYQGKGENRVFVGRVKRIKLCDKVRALELFAKHLRLLVEQLDIPKDANLTKPLSNLEVATRLAFLMRKATAAMLEERNNSVKQSNDKE